MVRDVSPCQALASRAAFCPSSMVIRPFEEEDSAQPYLHTAETALENPSFSARCSQSHCANTKYLVLFRRRVVWAGLAFAAKSHLSNLAKIYRARPVLVANPTFSTTITRLLVPSHKSPRSQRTSTTIQWACYNESAPRAIIAPTQLPSKRSRNLLFRVKELLAS